MRLLIVDDEAVIRNTTLIAIETAGHEAAEAPNGGSALRAIEEDQFDIVFLDLKLGMEDGLEVLAKLLKAQPTLNVVLFTAYANIATAVEAMRRGAYDFVPKPFTPDQIRGILAKIDKTRVLQTKVRTLESEIASESPPIDLQSAEPAMQQAISIAFKAAETPANRRTCSLIVWSVVSLASISAAASPTSSRPARIEVATVFRYRMCSSTCSVSLRSP